MQVWALSVARQTHKKQARRIQVGNLIQLLASRLLVQVEKLRFVQTELFLNSLEKTQTTSQLHCEHRSLIGYLTVPRTSRAI
uniref:Uncharacterized protein n=1 Tax=Salix viminalis TaxID=40686 RepID=A0A6N2LRH6_SALVM